MGLIDESAWAFCWVVDAPLFEPANVAMAAGDVTVGAGAWTAVHHAFTAPQDLETFDSDPGSALAYAYDIVCNGNEIGGGSIRIHRGTSRSGCSRSWVCLRRRRRRGSASCWMRSTTARPTAGSPSGGIGSAPSCPETDSIRDVIAFPKTGGGMDPLTDARRPSREQRKEAGIDVQPEI